MPCPDEVTLDLWSADALDPTKAAAVASHVAGCDSCTAQQRRSHAGTARLRAALDLDQDERAYLATLNLASRWRAQSNRTADRHLGWLALFAVIGAFLAWTLAAPLLGAVGQLLGAASMVGVGTVVLTTVIAVLLGAAQAVIELSLNPALGLSQPLLAVLALALLIWPRVRPASHPIGGVQS
jgi:anti-sigma factor RsiW